MTNSRIKKTYIPKEYQIFVNQVFNVLSLGMNGNTVLDLLIKAKQETIKLEFAVKSLILISLITFSSQVNAQDFWAYNSKKPGVGKVNVQRHVYGKEVNCATYPRTSYTSAYLKRKQHFYRADKHKKAFKVKRRR
jgi:hypothetical protein